MTNQALPTYLLIILTSFFICSAAPPLHAQSSDWAELPLPGSTNISALYANSDTLLAARATGLRNTGVYRSADKGQTWTEIPGFETNTDGSIVGCFVAGKNALFAAGRGVRQSSDGGRTWTPLNNGLTLDPSLVPPIGCLAVSGDTFVATAGFPYQAVFISTNGGANWSEQNVGLPVGTNFVYGPATISEGNLLLWVMSQLFRYRQETRSWVRLGSFPNPPDFPLRDRNSFVAREKNIFIVGRENNPPQKVFRSTDSGTSWTGFLRGLPTNQISSFSKIYSVITDDALLYASATPGEPFPMPSATVPGNVYFSDDDGETWGVATKPLALNSGNVRFDFSFVFSHIALSGADIYAVNEGKLYCATLNPPVVSAASYRALDVTNGSICALFGSNLTAAAPPVAKLPETEAPLGLNQALVQVTDSAGRQRNAFLFSASPTQINFQIPPETAPGLATITLAGTNQVWRANVATVAPSLFTADASGKGLPAGVALRLRADGTQSYEAIFQLDAQNRPVALPLDLSRENETVFLVLFGTGVRGRSALARVTARVGGLNVPVEYAGLTPGLVGLDQINLRLPRALMGRGEVEVEVQADGKKANLVKVTIK